MNKRKILVIDDEPDILKAIACRLEATNEFIVGRATDGYDAAFMTMEDDYDCLFIDIMMPGFNGLEVCRKLKSHPHTAAVPIVIMSAACDEETVTEAIKVGASDYLRKPFLLNVLVDKARKWSGYSARRKAMGSSDADLLPPKAGSEMNLPRLGNNSRAKIRERLTRRLFLGRAELITRRLGEVVNVGADQPLDIDLLACDIMTAAELFMLANSAFIGARSEVSGFSEAINRLGTDSVGEKISRLAGQQLKVREITQGYILNYFWGHSLSTACIAETLGRYTNYSNSEELFTAGLFHDVGKLFFATYYPEIYVHVANTESPQHMDITERERDVFGIDHREVGNLILKTWRLPEAVQKACLHHNQEEAFEGTRVRAMLRIISVANEISNVVISEKGPSHSVRKSVDGLRDVRDQMALPIGTIMESVTRRIARVATILQLPSPIKRTTSDILDIVC